MCFYALNNTICHLTNDLEFDLDVDNGKWKCQQRFLEYLCIKEQNNTCWQDSPWKGHGNDNHDYDPRLRSCI